MSVKTDSESPIGVFDSGVGGISVLSKLEIGLSLLIGLSLFWGFNKCTLWYKGNKQDKGTYHKEC